MATKKIPDLPAVGALAVGDWLLISRDGVTSRAPANPESAGASAYEVAVDSGFVGTEAQWLASLVGPQGQQGIEGPQGIKGDAGNQGTQGIQGPKGDQGIQGVKGDTGEQGIQGIPGTTGAKGDKGDKGDQGEQGIPGPKGDPGSTALATPSSDGLMPSADKTKLNAVGTMANRNATTSTADPSGGVNGDVWFKV